MRWFFAAIAVALGALTWWLVNPIVGICVAIVLMPPSLDPAIRLLEWQIKRHRQRVEGGDGPR